MKISQMPLVAIVFVATANAAFAQDYKKSEPFTISSGDLAVALQQLASQSNANIIYNPDLATGQQTNGVNGEFTEDQAIEILLDGTNMVYQESNGAIIISQSSAPATRRFAQSVSSANSDEAPSERASDSTNRKSSALLDTVIVTARKRKESAQSVPASISALGERQIEYLKIRDLTNLSVSLPNVALDDIGSVKGTANFSIRGLGINSSIPSIDPTVGVFIDGVYLGQPTGVIFDTFDLESVEVLRGPQGTLFGRNVTGGAILVNTRKPRDTFEVKLRSAIDGGGAGGMSTYLMGSIGGPLTESLRAKLSLYYNKDQGYFRNSFDGKKFGELEQFMVRPIVVFSPTDRLETVLKYEFTQIEGDGPPSQTHSNGSGIPGTPENFSRDSFDFSIDNPGLTDSEAHFVSNETNWRIGFGNGVITNVFGWRSFKQQYLTDVDAQPIDLFNIGGWIDAEQFSNELRYSGRFGDRLNIVFGGYYFNNSILYHERRTILTVLTGNGTPFLQQDGGGDYNVETLAAFGSMDFDVTEDLTLTVGARYTHEEKDVVLTSLSAPKTMPCNILDGTCII